jgi:hypothetical protein
VIRATKVDVVKGMRTRASLPSMKRKKLGQVFMFAYKYPHTLVD